MINHFAPIVIPTLNRYEHFKNCIESLLRCTGSVNTDLFVFLDYPTKESHWDGYNKIDIYCSKIIGFNNVHLIKRSRNFGAYDNLIAGINLVFQDYESVILTEDDNVFSGDFLNFMNKGLEKFKTNEDVFSVSGYSYPIKIPKVYKPHIYSWIGFSAWGVGLWRNKMQKIDFAKSIILNETNSFMQNYSKVYKLSNISNHYISALLHMNKNNVVHMDTFLSMYIYENKMYTIFPVISRVRNLGHDGSGVNCHIDSENIYSQQPLYQGSASYDLSISEGKQSFFNELLYNRFKISLKSKIKLFIKVVIYNFRKEINIK